MINRSSNISARRSNGGSGGGGGNNIVVLADHESSKMKERRKGSKSSLLPPLLIAAVILLLIDSLRLFRPSSSTDEEDDTLGLRSDSTASLRKPSDSSSDTSSTNKHQHLINSDTKYKLTPKHQFPKGWQNFSYDDIRHHFNCRQRSKDLNKPLPTLGDWNFMRQTYAQIVVNNHGRTTTLPWTNDLVPPTLGYSLTPSLPIPPPYYAKLSPGKGRGLFASRNIHKGELVHDGTVSDVIFPNAMAFREYVFSFSERSEYACDAAEWVWMQQLEKGGEYHLLMGISISALMNGGGAEWGDAEGKKVNCMPENEYSGKFYATRDIGVGEEILTDYDIYYTKWKLVGL